MIINIKNQNSEDKLSTTIEYYKRINNRWERDESTNIETTDSDIFCNLQEKCISDTKSYSNDCESMKLNELELKSRVKKICPYVSIKISYQEKEELNKLSSSNYFSYRQNIQLFGEIKRLDSAK